MAKKAKWTKALNLMIAPTAYDKIKYVSDFEEISIAEWVRNALDEKLEREWPNYECQATEDITV